MASSPPRRWRCLRRFAEAVKALEDAGVLSWVQRIKRVRERCPDLLGNNGWRWRVLRTSNAYNFRAPARPIVLSPKSRLEHRIKTFPFNYAEAGIRTPLRSLSDIRMAPQ